MRVTRSAHLVFANRPFAGGLGASLYVGIGSAGAINYRRNLILDGADELLTNQGQIGLGSATFPKCQAVAQISSPSHSFNYTLPAAFLGQKVFAQVRTFQADYENDSILRPRSISVSVGGANVNQILGTATIVSVASRDAGGLRLTFNYLPNRDGLQPVTFSLVCTAGGSIPAVSVPASLAARTHEISVSGLANGTTYTFSLTATNGGTSVTLASGISFTCSTSGSGPVTSLVAIAN